MRKKPPAFGVSLQRSRHRWPNTKCLGMMSRVEVAAHLGDNAAAVRFLREAFSLGLPRTSRVFVDWTSGPSRAHQPFEDLMRPKG